MFAVVEFNQASRMPGDTAWLRDDLEAAQGLAGDLAAEMAEIGRREQYRVYELTEMDLEEER